MYSNPFVSQLVAEERMRDAMRLEEKARLVRAAQGTRNPGGWSLQLIFAPNDVWAGVVTSVRSFRAFILSIQSRSRAVQAKKELRTGAPQSPRPTGSSLGGGR